jgi:arsenite-transporting ATPase
MPERQRGADAPRVILFTGKGGVGKTTAAAATALRCAEQGLRTIVVSTDPAHSLADSFDCPLGPLRTELAPNLWGEQLDAQDRLEDSWIEIQAWLREVLEWAGVDAIEAEELALLPGLDELFGLVDIKAHVDSGEWNVVVVDCAPTAETLRLLSLPDVLAWYMNRVFPVGRRVNKLVAPVLARVSTLPVAGDEVFAATRRLYDRLAAVRDLLTDVQRTSVRLVVNPERMVIAEASRTYTYLSLFGYRVDAVIANRLLPADVVDPWFKAWKETHAEHLAAIEEGFAPLPVLRAELAADELVGIPRLREFGARLYGDIPPAALLHEADAMAVTRCGEERELTLPLPNAERDELELGRRQGELLVRVGSYRRSIVLPESLRRREVLGASLDGARLRVRFGVAQQDCEDEGGSVA